MLLAHPPFYLGLSQSGLSNGQLERSDKVVGEDIFVFVVNFDLEFGILGHLHDDWMVR